MIANPFIHIALKVHSRRIGLRILTLMVEVQSKPLALMTMHARSRLCDRWVAACRRAVQPEAYALLTACP
jgi:hypothetical protein